MAHDVCYTGNGVWQNPGIGEGTILAQANGNAPGARRKILVLFGTRPEAIKMAPVIPALAQHSESFEVVACSTGQHREMLDQVLELFGIVPAYELGVMVENQTLPKLTARLVEQLDRVFTQEKPDVVLVHGDTTTALAGALAAYYHRIPVGHVEAGLRTHDRYHPFPEEMNRHLVDVLSTYLFAPTSTAREHLLQEGIPPDRINVTGNTVIDALHMVLEKPCSLPLELDWDNRRVILVTAHRRESFGQPLENICNALLEITRQHEDVEVVYPVHRNPNVWDLVHRRLGGAERIHLLEPLGYAEFVHLMAKSYLILTDSGGIQEEAPALGVPVVVLREVTERPEAVEAGTVRVVGTSTDRIVSCVAQLMEAEEHQKMAQAINPYGDGQAAQRIATQLMEALVL